MVRKSVTGLLLSNENTIGLAVVLLSLVLREASRGARLIRSRSRDQESSRDRSSTKCILKMSLCQSLLSPASQETGLNT